MARWAWLCDKTPGHVLRQNGVLNGNSTQREDEKVIWGKNTDGILSSKETHCGKKRPD